MTQPEVVIDVKPLLVGDALSVQLLFQGLQRLISVAPEDRALSDGHLCPSNLERNAPSDVLRQHLTSQGLSATTVSMKQDSGGTLQDVRNQPVSASDQGLTGLVVESVS